MVERPEGSGARSNACTSSRRSLALSSSEPGRWQAVRGDSLASVTAIWRNKGTGWELLATAGFPDEATLHTLVEESPHLLPLAGSPRVAILGREVQRGTGYADLIGVERDGRMVVIEVKLAKNAEARRAVVSQVLAYAAYLHGTDVTTLETDLLRAHLKKRGFDTLADAVRSMDQEGAFDAEAFGANLRQNLQDGRFRLVMVLDSAPDELARLAGYLEVVAEKVLIDLVTVSAYEVAGSKIIVPQRVEAERHREEASVASASSPAKGVTTDGADAFDAAIEKAEPEERAQLKKLVEWARGLERSATRSGILAAARRQREDEPSAVAEVDLRPRRMGVPGSRRDADAAEAAEPKTANRCRRRYAPRRTPCCAAPRTHARASRRRPIRAHSGWRRRCPHPCRYSSHAPARSASPRRNLSCSRHPRASKRYRPRVQRRGGL